jgi:hypothetical protein
MVKTPGSRGQRFGARVVFCILVRRPARSGERETETEAQTEKKKGEGGREKERA